MKIRARLAYGVILSAELPDSPLFATMNMQTILNKAADYARPMLHAALTGALAKLGGLGIKIAFSDARLEITPEQP